MRPFSSGTTSRPEDQVGVAVGIDAHRWQPSAETLLQLVYQPEDIVQAVGGLPIAAEDDLPVGADVPAEEAVQRLLPGGLPFQPEGVLRINGASLPAVTQAEFAVAVALVGEIHIEGVFILVGYGHEKTSFF